MLFDPQEPTVFRYRAFPVSGEFVLRTEQYDLSGFAENAEPLFLISMLPPLIIPLIGAVLFR